MTEHEQWPLTVQDRRDAINALTKMLRSDDGPVAIRAVRLILQMEELNLRFEAEADRKLRANLRKLAGQK
jgi:hypothetical protein